jgi:DNA modification methylase
MADNLKIEYRSTDSLNEYDGNSKTHDAKQVSKLCESIKKFGFNNPILVDSDGVLIAGHGRLMAARELGLEEVPVIELGHLTDQQRRAYVIADNKLAELSDWDQDALARELSALAEFEFDTTSLGFTDKSLNSIMAAAKTATAGGLTDPNAAPVVDDDVTHEVSREGDIWILGDHRVMCGDSTSAEMVGKLMAGEKADLIHADPPYGMGKQKDGVENDNLYKEHLDEFQMGWWVAFRQYANDNASAYIWGNAPDLWRLWYRRLEQTEEMLLRNEIVWDKKSIPGMKSDLMTQYAITTERCLFIQIGKQFLGNVNTEDYPEEWDVVRGYLAEEAEKVELTSKRLQEVCGVGMYSHWFTKSQFCLIPNGQYDKLQAEFPDNFRRPWAELKADWVTVRGRARGVINEKLGIVRSYFDNAHDIMRDVWEFKRVVGDERHGHATPKPVDMMNRVMLSSLQEGGICAEPFAGSGSTLMGAEMTDRRCFTMELQPKYVDVVVRRWCAYTGKPAILEGDGRNFDQIRDDRVPVDGEVEV